jgi:ribosome-binding protein aMBF1 (putative translation factor)
LSKPPSPRADQLRKQREEKYEAEQKRQADEKKRKRKKQNQPGQVVDNIHRAIADAHNAVELLVVELSHPIQQQAKIDAIMDLIREYGDLRYDDGFRTGYDCANEEQEMASS